MDMTERIARLLAKGLKPSLVATMVGCSPSYVSNLTADPDFREVVAELKGEITTGATSKAAEAEVINDRLLALEHQVLNQIEERLAFLQERDLINLFDKLGTRRDRLTAPATVVETASLGADGLPTRLVRITVPSICAPDLTIGSDNEIIAIGSRSVNPMPTAALQRLLDEGSEPEALEADYEEFQTDRS